MPGSERGYQEAQVRTALEQLGEATEEGVALRVHHNPVAPPLVFLNTRQVLSTKLRAGVGVAVRLQQPGRALDIGEEEGDRAGGQLSHGRPS